MGIFKNKKRKEDNETLEVRLNVNSWGGKL